ncbi:MAG: Hsp20/alpha crystallin family protein [Gammaproteobacteria bacterium]|nr:Hsp20/alpha crystallin family protein [Gammaproteobacteria bacterium]MBI5616581.1 Hsp20/alpha crystallin family protein [Gammaproteobacteria bacterium]
MTFENLKENLSSLWDSVAEGWQHLAQSANSALTRFKPGAEMPDKREVDDTWYLPTRGWAMLGGDVFEDTARIVVRLEVPGLQKQDLRLEIEDNALVVSGEKRFERESTQGRWRVMQCAYGSFRRVVPLPASVAPEQAKASYREGVLRVEIPKLRQAAPEGRTIPID